MDDDDRLLDGLESLPPPRSVTLNLWRSIAAAGLVLAAFSVFLSAYLFDQRAKQLEDAIRGSCQRVNALRSTVNHNSHIIHRTLEGLAVAERQLATLDDHGPLLYQQRRRLARRYQRLAHSTRRTGLTDCDRAITDPLGYQQPKPEPFPR